MESRRNRKKLEMQKHIVCTAMSMFENHGFELTTMEGIADACDIAKATLYRYFPAKEAIIADYWRQKSDAAKDQFPDFLKNYPDTRSRLEAYLQKNLSEAMKNHDLFSIYFRYRLQHRENSKINNKSTSGFNKLLQQILITGIAEKEIRSDIPSAILVRHFEILNVMIFTALLDDPKVFDAEKSISMMVELFLQGGSYASPI